MTPLRTPMLVVAALLIAGCDQLGIESAQAIAGRREADGKAIGSACRHAGRALEDCFVLNRRADKAAVLAGWREMNDYMRENKIEVVTPQLTPTTETAGKARADADGAPAATGEAKPARGS